MSHLVPHKQGLCTTYGHRNACKILIFKFYWNVGLIIIPGTVHLLLPTEPRKFAGKILIHVINIPWQFKYCRIGNGCCCNIFAIFSLTFPLKILQQQIFILYTKSSKKSQRAKLLQHKYVQILKILQSKYFHFYKDDGHLLVNRTCEGSQSYIKCYTMLLTLVLWSDILCSTQIGAPDKHVICMRISYSVC